MYMLKRSQEHHSSKSRSATVSQAAKLILSSQARSEIQCLWMLCGESQLGNSPMASYGYFLFWCMILLWWRIESNWWYVKLSLIVLSPAACVLTMLRVLCSVAVVRHSVLTLRIEMAKIWKINCHKLSSVVRGDSELKTCPRDWAAGSSSVAVPPSTYARQANPSRMEITLLSSLVSYCYDLLWFVMCYCSLVPTPF